MDRVLVIGGAGFIGSRNDSFFARFYKVGALAKNLGKTKGSVLRALGVRAVK